MPEYEDSFGLEDFLGLNNVLNEVVAVVVDFSPHVVYHEWLGEVVFIV